MARGAIAVVAKEVVEQFHRLAGHPVWRRSAGVYPMVSRRTVARDLDFLRDPPATPAS